MMRKKFVPLIIVAIVTALTLWGHFEVKGTVNTAREQLDEIRSCAENEDYEGAEEEIKKLLRDFDAKQHMLELFVKRENVSAVSVNLHGLEAYANDETARDLMSEVDKASEQLSMLEHLFFSVF